jgi:hypothetical protein
MELAGGEGGIDQLDKSLRMAMALTDIDRQLLQDGNKKPGSWAGLG